MIISYFALLPIDNPHVVAVDIGKAIKPIPKRFNVIELVVVAIISNVSNCYNIVVNVLCFFKFFFDLWFLSLKKPIISLMLLIGLLKLFTSFIFLFLLNLGQTSLKVQCGIIFSVPYI